MRTIFYSVTEKITKEKINIGPNYFKAEERLAELKKENPKGEYVITYKWGNI